MNTNGSSIIPAAPAKAWSARLRMHGWALLGLLLCQLGQVLAALLLLGFSADVIDQGIAARSPDAIPRYGAWMGAASLAQLVLSVVAAVLGAQIAFRVGQALRADVFAKVHNLALAQAQGFQHRLPYYPLHE
jgi:ATP-binding cassette, subfamily B, multidrug efflux pump